jgi:hypothetical protein
MLLLSVAAVPAADSPGGAALHGPSLGMLFDPSARTLRPLLGFPGAAMLGSPLPLPRDIVSVRSSPRGGYALALKGDERTVIEITPAGTRPLRTLHPAPDRIAFSPSGSHVALYYSDRGSLDLVSGLPQAPLRFASIDFSVLPGPLSALAVSDSGAVLAACALGGDAAAIYSAARRRPAALALSARRISAIAYLGSTNEALAADASANLIYRLRDSGATVIAGSAEGVSTPVALAATQDGRRAVVANSGTAPLLLLDLDGGAPRTLSCSCRTAVVEPLAGNAVFQLSAPGSRRLWLLDLGTSEPRFFFVPETPRQ